MFRELNQTFKSPSKYFIIKKFDFSVYLYNLTDWNIVIVREGSIPYSFYWVHTYIHTPPALPYLPPLCPHCFSVISRSGSDLVPSPPLPTSTTSSHPICHQINSNQSLSVKSNMAIFIAPLCVYISHQLRSVQSTTQSFKATKKH